MIFLKISLIIFKTEILQRRIEEASADKERMKGRLVILETRIQEKEEELSNLMASRNRWTDVEQLRKVDQLSVEVGLYRGLIKLIINMFNVSYDLIICTFKFTSKMIFIRTST